MAGWACPMSALVVAVLAGGLSSRMGQDKRFLKIGSESLLDRAVSLGENFGRVLICGQVAGRECLPDKIPGQGPISGLLSVAAEITEPAWVLVLPVDMPLLNFALLNDLIKQAQKPGLAYQDYELPLLFWCDARAVSILENLERWSIKAFLEALGAQRIDLNPAWESCFTNLNCPSDLEKLLEYSI